MIPLTLEQLLWLLRSRAEMLANLTATQIRCTQLLEETRDLRQRLAAVAEELERARAGILLPGWTCRECRIFNGSAKELLEECRSCGASRRAA